MQQDTMKQVVIVSERVNEKLVSEKLLCKACMRS